jgi:hypothetical protein
VKHTEYVFVLDERVLYFWHRGCCNKVSYVLIEMTAAKKKLWPASVNVMNFFFFGEAKIIRLLLTHFLTKTFHFFTLTL